MPPQSLFQSAALLTLDAGLLAFIATVILRLASPADVRIGTKIILYFLCVTALILGSAPILSLAGALGPKGFLVLHAGLAALAIPLWRCGSPSPIGRERPSLLVRLGAVALVTVFAVLLFQAFLAEPLTFDSNTYRLTRIGAWLQNGQLAAFPNNDIRHNYVPCYPDLLMLWVTSFFAKGYPAVNTVQTLCGFVLCVTTWELASILRFRVIAKLAIIAALLSFPNVALQLVTSQTDVIATALAFSGIVFLWHAVQTRDVRYWIWCGLAFGVAIGAKPTVLFLGPGCLALLVYWARKRWPITREDARGLAAGAFCALLVAAPPYLNNLRIYGRPFVPQQHAAKLDQSQTLGYTSIAAKHMTAYAWQLFEPNSNPLLPRAFTEPIYSSLARVIGSWEAPPSPAFRIRFDIARRAYTTSMPNEDVASSGVLSALAPALAAGLLLFGPRQLRRESIDRPGTLILLSTLGVFLLLFAAFEEWTPSRYRYCVLLTPIAAIAVGVLIESFRFRWAAWSSAIVIIAGLFSLGVISATSYHHGWLTILKPSRTPHSERAASMRKFVSELPQSCRHIGLALREDTWIAPFLRTGHPIDFEFIPLARLEPSRIAKSMQDRGLNALILNADRVIDPAMPQLKDSHFIIVGNPDQTKFPPRLTRTSGFFPDGWTVSDFSVDVQNAPKSSTLVLKAINACGFDRDIEVSINGQAVSASQVKANAPIRISVELPTGTSSIGWKIRPAFVPSRDTKGSTDNRNLGLFRPVFSEVTPNQK